MKESEYRCSGIHAIHTCEQDPINWDRYSRYRNKDSIICDDGAALMESGIKSGHAAAFLNSKYGTRIRSRDLHRITQTQREHSLSLIDIGLGVSEVSLLLDAITTHGDQFRIKFKDTAMAVMDCILYWDPADVQISQRFCQVLQVDSTFKDNIWKYPLLEITATTNEMNTFVIAQALIPTEDAASLLWIFEQVF